MCSSLLTDLFFLNLWLKLDFSSACPFLKPDLQTQMSSLIGLKAQGNLKNFLRCQEMSDDVSLGAEQKTIRSAEVLAPAPEHFLDHCLCS